MNNFNLVDPNKVILGNNPLLQKLDNGIPAIEDIRSFAELTMKPRNSNYIQIANGSVVNNSNVSSGEEIIITGYFNRKDKKQKDINYYSTNYTEDNRKEYEGFGIKNIDITFDANKIPQVAITFHDVRGNVLNNFNSKFAKMFQLPYPIFNLRIKGGFGPTIEYRLQKIRDDISIDDSGNFTINSKFIGDRFAPLSDLPLNYLQAVPYFGRQKPNVDDNIIKSFHELIINSKRLFEKINQEVESDQEKGNQDEIRKIEEKITSLNDIKVSLDSKDYLKLVVTESEGYKKITDKTSQTRIVTYLESSTFDNNQSKITFKTVLTPSLPIQPSEYNIISNAINDDIKNKNDVISKQNYSNLIKFDITTSQIDPNNFFNKPNFIDYSELSKTIDSLRQKIEDLGNKYASSLTDRLQNLVTESLGTTGLKIGNIFKLMFDDYNILMDKIFQAGEKGFLDNARYGNTNQTYDKIGFPTVVENINGVNTLIYPGKNPNFQNWAEVIFIEEFLEAFIESQITNLLTDLANSKNEDGSNKYIPVNPREIYKFGTDLNPDKNSAPNIYQSKNVEEICQLIYERFLIFTNINLEITASESTYKKWNNNNDSVASFRNFFTDLFKDSVEDTDNQEQLFLSFIQTEARNIAFALMLADPKVKNYFINLKNQFTDENYFTQNPNEPLTLGQSFNAFSVGTTNTMKIGLGTSKIDKDYVTVSNTGEPSLINSNNVSESSDIITTYMKSVNELNEDFKITLDNVLYIPDGNSVDDKTDYLYENFISKLSTNNYSLYKVLYDSRVPETRRGGNDSPPFPQSIFNFVLLYQRTKYPCLVQIPQAMLIILAKRLDFLVANGPTNSNDSYILTFENRTDFSIIIPEFHIIKDTNFYNYLIKLSNEIDKVNNQYGYQVINNVSRDSNGDLIDDTHRINIKKNDGSDIGNTPDEIRRLEEFLFEPVYLSVNSRELIFGPSFTIDEDKTLYSQYLKNLLPVLSELVKKDKETLEEKLKGYRSQMRDNEVKLAVYKSFQVIYENYLFGYKKENYQFNIKENFKFVDRAYNDISTKAVLDIKTLLSDSQDTNVSLFSAISRLLSNNNFWFYPFQGFLTDTKGYNDLFKIDISQKITTKPLFIAMYVGGLSSNPNGPPNSTISDDGIKKNSIPADFTKSGKTLSAFLVKYTGIQNQIVFSNFEHSTESLKNTDEGLRIQSEVISNASNSLAIPKGQSLLNVYQKQSYTSTIKIPYGNMGIQPTQYYYLEFMPIFEGLYIVYNVTHNINSDTQRLETTFKGYRLKKDVNPIVEQEIVDFVRNNFYTQTLEKIGIPSRITNLTPQQIAAIESATTRNDKVSGFKVISTYLRKNGIVHGAIDIGTPNGTALKFTLPNTTFVRKKEDKNGYGNYIVLKNNKENKYFYFAHLQEFSPYINNLKGEEATNPDTIDITQLLGKTGDTGRARTLGPGQDGNPLKPHLHFEVRDSDNLYRLDYNPYLQNLVLFS